MADRRFVTSIGAVAACVAGLAIAACAGASTSHVMLSAWTTNDAPNVVTLRLSQWRRPAHGEIEAIVTLKTPDGGEYEVGRFVPTEQGDAHEIGVSLILPTALRSIASAAGSQVHLRLSRIHGDVSQAHLSLVAAKLERLEAPSVP